MRPGNPFIHDPNSLNFATEFLLKSETAFAPVRVALANEPIQPIIRDSQEIPVPNAVNSSVNVGPASFSTTETTVPRIYAASTPRTAAREATTDITGCDLWTSVVSRSPSCRTAGATRVT